jgi:hypothetical protein
VLVTHDHFDRNGVSAIGGEPKVVCAAGRSSTPVGEVIGIASENDNVGGTRRGANVIFVFEFDGVRVCHFRDFGQAELRPEQERAIANAVLLFIPVGGEYTIGGKTAAGITKQLGRRCRSWNVGFDAASLAAVTARWSAARATFRCSPIPFRLANTNAVGSNRAPARLTDLATGRRAAATAYYKNAGALNAGARTSTLSPGAKGQSTRSCARSSRGLTLYSVPARAQSFVRSSEG